MRASEVEYCSAIFAEQYSLSRFEGVESRISPGPYTAGPAVQVAGHAMRAAMRQGSGRLVRQPLGWIDNFCFQTDFLSGVMAVLELDRFPGFDSHSTTSCISPEFPVPIMSVPANASLILITLPV
jgi:hypothetical protein